MARIHPGADLLVVTGNGFGKRTSVDEYRLQRRGGKGVKTFRVTPRTGEVVGIKIIKSENEVMVVSAQGIMIRLKVADISRQGRNTQGVTLMRMESGDQVVALARIMGKEGSN